MQPEMPLRHEPRRSLPHRIRTGLPALATPGLARCGKMTQQVQKYSLQVLPQPRFHWVKKRSRHCCRNSPLVTFGPPLLKGGGGDFWPGLSKKIPPFPPFPKGGIFASFRLTSSCEIPPHPGPLPRVRGRGESEGPLQAFCSSTQRRFSRIRSGMGSS